MKLTIKILVLMLMASVSQQLYAGETVDRTLPANADVEIWVENIAGEVIIEAWDRNEVRILAEIGDDVDALEIEGDEDGYSFVVEVNDHHNYGWRFSRAQDVDSKLELWVPARAYVQTETVSASASVTGVHGGLEIESVSGSVDLHGVSGGVEAETVSGELRVEAEGDSVYAESVSGTVSVSGASGDIQAASVSGSVEIGDSTALELDLETVSGSITFDGSLASGAEVSAESVSGAVKLILPAGIEADFDIETFSGSISSDFGGNAEHHSKYAPGQSLNYSTGDNVEICIETLSGSVSLISR